MTLVPDLSEVSAVPHAARPVDRDDAVLPPPPYLALPELLRLVPEPQGHAVRQLFAEHAALFAAAPGSAQAHQAWTPGGYADHLTECGNIAIALYATLDARRRLPFSLGDALLVLLLHDVEKPIRYVSRLRTVERATLAPTIPAETERLAPLARGEKADRAAFRRALLRHYRIDLSPAQTNAMAYIEGEGDDYRPGERVMGPLAAFCHTIDVLSARLWHDAPGPTDHWARWNDTTDGTGSASAATAGTEPADADAAGAAHTAGD